MLPNYIFCMWYIDVRHFCYMFWVLYILILQLTIFSRTIQRACCCFSRIVEKMADRIFILIVFCVSSLVLAFFFFVCGLFGFINEMTNVRNNQNIEHGALSYVSFSFLVIVFTSSIITFIVSISTFSVCLCALSNNLDQETPGDGCCGKISMFIVKCFWTSPKTVKLGNKLSITRANQFVDFDLSYYSYFGKFLPYIDNIICCKRCCIGKAVTLRYWNKFYFFDRHMSSWDESDKIEFFEGMKIPFHFEKIKEKVKEWDNDKIRRFVDTTIGGELQLVQIYFENIFDIQSLNKTQAKGIKQAVTSRMEDYERRFKN